MDNSEKPKPNGKPHAGYPYRNLVIPSFMIDPVREALIAQAGRIGIFDPGQAEKLRRLARQL